MIGVALSTYLFDKPQVASFDYKGEGDPEERVLTLTGSGSAVSMALDDFSVSTESVYQVSYTFDNNAYAFVFGERAGVYSVSATAFPDWMVCSTEAQGLAIDDLQTFFQDHRLRTGYYTSSPVTMVVGPDTKGKTATAKKTLIGYLLSFEMAAQAEDSMRIHVRFTLLGYPLHTGAPSV